MHEIGKKHESDREKADHQLHDAYHLAALLPHDDERRHHDEARRDGRQINPPVVLGGEIHFEEPRRDDDKDCCEACMKDKNADIESDQLVVEQNFLPGLPGCFGSQVLRGVGNNEFRDQDRSERKEAGERKDSGDAPEVGKKRRNDE